MEYNACKRKVIPGESIQAERVLEIFISTDYRYNKQSLILCHKPTQVRVYDGEFGKKEKKKTFINA